MIGCDADRHEGERWRPVVDYEGIYEVSDHGRVRSLARTAPTARGTRTVPAVVLKLIIEPGRVPYRKVNLSAGKQRIRGHRVHVLVLEAFVGPRPPNKLGCHADDDPANNYLTNLSWSTHLDNAADRRRNGRGNLHTRKTACDHGHALGEPNLTRRARVLGWRDCLACARGRGRVQSAARRGETLTLQAASDAAYAEILAAA